MYTYPNEITTENSPKDVKKIVIAHEWSEQRHFVRCQDAREFEKFNCAINRKWVFDSTRQTREKRERREQPRIVRKLERLSTLVELSRTDPGIGWCNEWRNICRRDIWVNVGCNIRVHFHKPFKLEALWLKSSLVDDWSDIFLQFTAVWNVCTIHIYFGRLYIIAS